MLNSEQKVQVSNLRGEAANWKQQEHNSSNIADNKKPSQLIRRFFIIAKILPKFPFRGQGFNIHPH
jgi:hypothetical protein